MTYVVIYFDKHNTKPSKKKSNNNDMHQPMKTDFFLNVHRMKEEKEAAILNLIA